MKRQTLSRPNLSAGFIAAPAPAGRARAWEKSHPTVSYRLPADLRDQITQLAQAHQVPTSDLARLLLEHALAAHAAGKLPIHPTLRTGRLTLFP